MSHRLERKRFRLDVVSEVLLERLAEEERIPEQALLKRLIHAEAHRRRRKAEREARDA